MYKVYRCVDGMPQEVLGMYNSLPEAYDYARRAAARESRPAVEYRILGPTPRGAPGVMRLQSAGRSATPLSAWFVLDNAPRPRGALRASEVLRSLGEEPGASESTPVMRINEQRNSSESQHAQSKHSNASSPQRTAPLHTTPPHKTYSVVREAGGSRHTLISELETKAEARSFIARHRGNDTNPQAQYIIVEVAPKSRRGKRSKRPVGVRPSFLRGAPRLHGYAAGSQRQRERHDWEVEDRRNDVSLVARPEDELGLGIPAQTNKGRRSRKGEYIP